MDRKATQVVALLLPGALLVSSGWFFRQAGQRLGSELGYLAGFAFYWLFWCLLVPWLAVRKDGLVSLLTDCRPLFGRQNWLAALFWVIVIVVAVWMYGKDFLAAQPAVMLVAFPLAAVNGVCEELLWRGLYVRVFPANARLGILYPAIGFAAWHFVPQMVYPAENLVGFVLSTFFLGLAFGYIAYCTGSAKWTAISHSLSGALALAAPLTQIIISLGRSWEM